MNNEETGQLPLSEINRLIDTVQELGAARNWDKETVLQQLVGMAFRKGRGDRTVVAYEVALPDRIPASAVFLDKAWATDFAARHHTVVHPLVRAL